MPSVLVGSEAKWLLFANMKDCLDVGLVRIEHIAGREADIQRVPEISND